MKNEPQKNLSDLFILSLNIPKLVLVQPSCFYLADKRISYDIIF